MNYLTDAIITILKSTTVSNAAGISWERWRDYHVDHRPGQAEYSHAMNAGRSPFVALTDIENEYDDLVDGQGSGFRNGIYTIRIFVICPSENRKASTFNKIQDIKRAIMAGLYANPKLEIRNISESSITISGYFYTIDLTVNTQTVFGPDVQEVI
jgi:hypothetical protein